MTTRIDDVVDTLSPLREAIRDVRQCLTDTAITIEDLDRAAADLGSVRGWKAASGAKADLAELRAALNTIDQGADRIQGRVRGLQQVDSVTRQSPSPPRGA